MKRYRLWRSFWRTVPHAESWLRALIEAIEEPRRRGCDCSHLDIARLEWISDPDNPQMMSNRHHVLHRPACPVLVGEPK